MRACGRSFVSGSRVSLLVAALLAPLSSAAPAGQHCATSCREETRACEQTRCTGLHGRAQRTCVETCRGIGGCAPIRTLAYVVARCHTDARGEVFRGALNIRRGDCDPVTVWERPLQAPAPDPLGLCSLFGQYRYGGVSALSGGVQRLGVRPDGSAVVFEVNNEIAVFGPPLLPEPEQEGFFFVRADGTGLRRLGPASRDPVSLTYPVSSSPIGIGVNVFATLAFSPDGRRVVFTDLGPGPAGETAIQIVTLTLAGQRTQVTRLPRADSLIPGLPATGFPGFIDDETLAFYSFANPDGLNPQGQLTAFTVRTDGTGLRALPVTDVAPPGGQVVPRFAIWGGRASIANLTLPGMAVNAIPGGTGYLLSEIVEVFVASGRNLLQLTQFHRVDTFGLFVDHTAQRAFFVASADPLGSNPTQNCQLFSSDMLGAHLRQVTHFREGDHSVNGCEPSNFPPPGGCAISLSTIAREDAETGTIVFDSSCDPFGTNPFGDQLFAVRGDGSRLRTLTHTTGFVRYPDGSVTTELVGNWDYAPSVR
jgi:hypothetical protein